MIKEIRILIFIISTLILALTSGCATKQPPPSLTYVAVELPTEPIKATGQQIETEHSRGGPYFLNFGFRPAPNVKAYLEKAQSESGSDVLKNTDIQLNIPFAFDILFFGFQSGSDTVKANQ